jgi:hypothetical protein
MNNEVSRLNNKANKLINYSNKQHVSIGDFISNKTEDLL